MNRIVSKIRQHLASQSQQAVWYDSIQQFFGSKKMWLSFTQRYLSTTKSKRILDLGCGTAEILQYLPKQTTYVGIDSHQPYIDSCQKKYGDRGLFQCGDWSDLCEGESYDVVLLLGLLHHLDNKSARLVIQKGLNSLVAGGHLISLDGCRPNNSSRFENFFYNSDRGDFVRNFYQYSLLFPESTIFSIHRDWLRVPYQYLVCQLKKD